MSLVDVLIGGGPSGLSAALTLVRQNHTVTVLDSSVSRALPSLNLHGYVGCDHTAPAEYLIRARNELKPYKSFAAVDSEVTTITKIDSGFEATDKTGGTHKGRKVILANGVISVYPDIRGYAECWGKGIFHNLFAQGYQQDPASAHAGVLAVDLIAMPQFTIHMTHLACQLANSVTIYTNGNEDLAKELASIIEGKPWKTDTRKIVRLALQSPAESVVNITFEDGSTAVEAFLGHSPFTRVGGPFAQQLDIKLSETGGEYETYGPFQLTSVSGVYAAGDTMSMFKVLPNAVASGAQAAAGVAVTLQEEKWGLPSVFG